MTQHPGVAILNQLELLDRLAHLPTASPVLQQNYPRFDSLAAWQASQVYFLLCLQQGGIVLCSKNKNYQPLSVDFLAGSVGYRGQQNVRNEMLVKAVLGRKKQYLPSILDATAGLGRDSFILATLGCAVTMVERHPIVQVLLADGLYRLHQQALADQIEVGQRMRLLSGDFTSLKGKMDDKDVVYLDPMFPHREKSALVKKEMQIFKQIVGADADSEHLLSIAKQLARQKVVVKRPSKADYLAGSKPTYSLSGRSSRFDIYQR